MRMAATAVFFRLLVLAAGAVFLAVLWNLPSWLGWTPADATQWLANLQLAGPMLAAALSTLAAVRSRGRDRQAWSMIAAGALLYILGNLAYIASASPDGPGAFPSPADAVFFVMALLFGAGIWLYGAVAPQPRAINTFNFTLLYGAMIFGTLFLLHHEIKASQLTELGTVAAFLYPALWISVATLTAVLLLIHPGGARRLPMALLAVAVTVEGVGDFIYAAQLMRGTYVVAGWPHLLWMVSAAFVGWAAVEHLQLLARQRGGSRDAVADHPLQPVGLAIAPALVVFAVLMTGTVAGAFGQGIYQYIAGFLTAILTTTVGLREYRIESTRRHLQKVAGEHLANLVEGEKRLSSVLESTSDSVVVLDLDWKVRFYNSHAQHFIPELVDVGIGGSFWDLFRPQEREVFGDGFERVLKTGEPWLTETYNPSRHLWVDLRVYPMGNGISLFFRDISDERRSREELAYLAHHDFLTGLSSRGIFSKKLDEALESGASRAIILIDLDFFKDINDTLGHALGDAVLLEVARRVRECAPEDCLVARLGGDEFALVLDNRSEEELLTISRDVIASISRPIASADQSLVVGASVGIASTNHGTAGADLFTRADIALYEAKAAGRGQALVFQHAMEARVKERNALLSELSRAAHNGELELDYQPLLDTASRQTAGFEALLRWRHPSRGLISPAEFITLAEEGGLIDEIGEWALRVACNEALQWPASLSVSVNISTRQLADPQFVRRLVGALTESGLDHRRLELEVTESALLREANLPILEEISDLGIRISLDDFGTGYSSLSYLQRFQFSKLKIDRSFIQNAPHDRKSQAIVGAVMDLARTLGMQVTAEGVETPEQFDWVARTCDQAQGYYVGRPMRGAEIPGYLAREVAAAPRLRA